MADEVSLTRLESSLIALRGSVDDFRGEQDRRWMKIEPVIMARSGELERMRNFERDLNHLGEKHRKLEGQVGHHKIELDGKFVAVETRFAARASDLEKRQDRAWWMVVGAFAVLQLLWLLLSPFLERVIGG